MSHSELLGTGKGIEPGRPRADSGRRSRNECGSTISILRQITQPPGQTETFHKPLLTFPQAAQHIGMTMMQLLALTSSPWALSERSKDEHGSGTGMRQLAAKRVKALCSLLYDASKAGVSGHAQ